MQNRKTILAVAVAIGLCASAYLGLTAYTATKVHHVVDQLQTSGDISSALGTGSGAFHNVRVDKGFFTTTVDADMTVSSWAGSGSGDMPVHAVVYQTPSFSGPAHFSMDIGAPQFGPMHDFFVDVNDAKMEHGTITKTWGGGIDAQFGMSPMHGVHKGIHVDWNGLVANLDVKNKSNAHVDMQAAPLSMSWGQGSRFGVQSVNATYDLHGGAAGDAAVDLSLGGVDLLDGKLALNLSKADLNAQAQWDVSKNDARHFFAIKNAALDVQSNDPKGQVNLQADGTLPLSDDLIQAAAKSPLLVGMLLPSLIESRATIKVSDSLLATSPDLRTQFQTLGAQLSGGQWLLQVGTHQGHVLVNGVAIK